MDAFQAVSSIDAVFSAILSWVWQSLLLGTVFAGVTYALVRLLRLRIGSALETGLWTIVLIKFLMPVGPSWSFSLSSVYARLIQRSPAHDIRPAEPIAFEAVNLYIEDIDAIDHVSPAPAAVAPVQSPPVEEAVRPRWRWTTPVGMAYALCVLGLLIRRLRSYHALVTHCKLLPMADRQTREVVLEVCRRLGVRRVPSVRISDERPPFVVGSLSPLLILSRHLLVRPDEMETAIVHEIAHLRRGDMFVRYLEWIAGTLFFFWPVVAWINRRLDAARECSCDQWALRQGRLSATEYARFLLGVVQPEHRARFSYAPSSMATNPKTIERRIDMVLKSQSLPSSRRIWKLTALAFLLVWAGFTLTGIAAGPDGAAYHHSRTATVESVQKRAATIYDLVREHDVADLNRDGLLSYLERDTYLVALAMRNSGAFMDEFPYADRNRSGNLDIIEAQDVIRAITLIAYADRRANAASEQVLPLEFCHAALDAQEWLLAIATSEPNPSELDPIWSVLCRIQGRPGSFAARMFDHGAGDQFDKRKKHDRGSRSQFHELEGNIAAIKDQLAGTSNPGRITKLELMLSKLEAILSKLQQ